MNELDDIGNSVFRQEALDLVAAIERGLLELERQPEDRERVNAVFRDLHTVKGSGAMFGFTELAQFTHEFETAFDRLRRGEVLASPDLIAVSLRACDQILRLIDTPEEAVPEGAVILADLRRVLNGPEADTETGDHAGAAAAAGAGSAPGPEGGAQTETGADQPVVIRFWLDRASLRLGHNPSLLLEELATLGPCSHSALIARVPDLAALDPSDCLIGWQVVIAAPVSDDQIEQVFMFHRDDMELQITRGPQALQAATAQNAEAPADPIAEPIAEPAVAAAPSAAAPSAAAPSAAAPSAIRAPVPLKAETPPEAKPAAKAPAKPSASQPPAAGETTRVATERLDELMDRVGELVIAEARLQALAAASRDPALLSVAEDIQRLAAGLRDSTMSMRMVPIASILGRFRRLMRDLSGSLGKPIEFVTLGEETELDKTVIELLADPLVHILRNSADHGLESPAERQAAGKPAQGRITLSAEYSGAEVLIRIADDGKGLDAARIRARAVAAGLIAAEAELPQSDLYRMIFEPGFSTAEKVTELSGRGVGMDVVKRTIASLRGQIDLDSVQGQGTTVTLRLPLTLAIIDGLLIDVGGERYTIPLAAVEECVELPASHVTQGGATAFLNIRGGLVPYLRLRALFSVDAPQAAFQKVVIVAASGSRVGLVVDRIIGNNQTVIKQLSPLHAGAKSFSGATILGDGTVALILDVSQLVASARISERERAA